MEPGITPPQLISGPPLTATREAVDNHSKGTLRARCIVTADGVARGCLLIESTPYMGDSYLAAISQWRFQPAVKDGNPVAVELDLDTPVDYSVPPAPMPAAPPTPQPGQSRGEVQFSPMMTRPERIDGPQVKYTPEAVCNRIEGLMVVRCVITEVGRIENCSIVKTLPYMEKATLGALEASRYTPITLNGKPVRVNYIFNIRFVLPRR